MKLLRIEWRKIRTNRTYIVLGILYLIFLVVSMWTFNRVFEEALSKQPMLGTMFSSNRFPDVWHYMAWIGTWFKIILGILVIIMVGNEYNFKTLRQQLINGLSRTEFFLGKFWIILLLAIGSTLLLFVTGLLLGLLNTPSFDTAMMFEQIHFLAGYFLMAIPYMLFAFLLVILLKRVGLTMGLLLLYDLIAERVLVYYVPESIDQFFPLNSIGMLVRFPLAFLNGDAVQTSIEPVPATMAVVFSAIYAFLIIWVLKKRDQ